MMSFLIAAAIVFGGWWLVRQFASSKPAKVRSLIRKIAGGAIMLLAGVLALRGAMNIALPLFMLGLGLLGQSAVFPNGFPWAQKSPGQKSRVETSILAMELDHDSGTMDGEVLSGPMKGRKLSTLNDAEIRSLMDFCAAARDQSLALFQAWLDRSHAGWRDKWSASGEGATTPSGGRMTAKEARQVLGLGDSPAESEVKAAHKALMKQFHPDRGGSDYLAAKINEAKDVLLQDLGGRT